MSAREAIPADTRRKQLDASDPAASAWVSANAGSGKTTVLVRRVIRLLLAGNPPARILCLTFTKAAAANMANRVLHTLGKWVRLDDEALDAEIREISPLTPSPELRARARRLFAAALETPGGLKVQTIHAFCDRVLHQFPFEAKVPAGFEVLDDVREADLLARARQSVLIDASAEPDSALGRALAHAVAVASDMRLEEALDEAVRERRKVQRLLAQDSDAAIAAALGLRPEDTTAAVEADILASPDLPPDQWPAIIEILSAGAKTEQGIAERLTAAMNAGPAERADAYLQVFLTQAGELRSRTRFYTKGFGEAHPELAERLDREFGRIEILLERRRAAQACERTRALLTLAGITIRRYEQLKAARGMLDYADLIERTADMLGDVGAIWVLYKLDGGIDHVLIDEAQDTSPEQWQVIAKLTEEFFSGQGAREDRTRTVFAVGDDKQSIFGFQGADPREFRAMRNHFGSAVRDAEGTFHDLRLDLSFRSAAGVLQAVDRVFSRPEAYAGLSSGDETNTVHEAIRTRAPALVEIWPTEKPDDDEDEGLAWDAPLDARSEASAVVRLAQRIARAVAFWLDGGIAVGDGDKRRTPRAGDVIVLVRRRGPLFEAILQALKHAKVPVAGADRLELAEHIAVMDLMALGDALTLEADDLSLACALKSPLFGLGEDDLYTLAHERKGSLAAAIEAAARKDSRFRDAAERLARWRKEAGELRPFDFYSRVLGRDRGRKRMLERLGMEAADALDEFLARALAYEQTETPSLAGFLAFLRRAGTEVKRDLEVESDSVRVMTVHGAKGLEAPVIVLADTASMPDGRYDRLLALPDSDALVWALSKDSDSAQVRAAREAAGAAREAEYRRLLYVALTRAADALVVCGHESKKQNELPEGCWYRLVHDALQGAEEKPELVEIETPYAHGKVWRWRPEKPLAGAREAAPEPQAIELPDWLAQPVPEAPEPPRRLTPSDLHSEEKAAGRAEGSASGRRAALQRGDLVHKLLQFLPGLPPEQQMPAAERFLSAAAPGLDRGTHAAFAEEALAVLRHPDMADLFGAQSRAEVDIAARLPATPGPGTPGIEISGRIDRLVVRPDAVLIADFKTDAAPPQRADQVPAGYIRQLALYRIAIQRVFPGRPVRAALLFTATPALIEIDAARLDAAAEFTL